MQHSKLFMKYIIATLFILASHISYSQSHAGELTPALEKKIKAEVEKSVAKLKTELKKSSETDLGIEFAIDTHRLNAFLDRYADTEYSSAGISEVEYKIASQYDSLLNKYYKNCGGKCRIRLV